MGSHTEDFRELLQEEFRLYGELSSSQLDRLENHWELLRRWNAKLNLTRIENVNTAVPFHYCESLYLGLKLPPGPLRIADVGSGAGFPGIPIAILRPDLTLSLIESDLRKAVFLREAVRSLPNTQVLASRAEASSERFDWLVSRAVSAKALLKLGLAPNLALLGTADSVPAGWESIRLPWGRNRAIVVSRETSVLRS